jgi:hypothetical protein
MLHTSLILNSDMSYAMSDYAHKYSEVCLVTEAKVPTMLELNLQLVSQIQT